MKRYYGYDGLEFDAPDHSCPFCKHCTDIFYDSEGAYGFGCLVASAQLNYPENTIAIRDGLPKDCIAFEEEDT